jgi:hypothetical protein
MIQGIFLQRDTSVTYLSLFLEILKYKNNLEYTSYFIPNVLLQVSRQIVLRGNIFTISFKHGLEFISYINKYVTRATKATYQIFVKERLLYEVL